MRRSARSVARDSARVIRAVAATALASCSMRARDKALKSGVRRWPALAVVAVVVVVGIAPSARASSFPGSNGKIAFETTRDGASQVWVMDPDGGNPVSLTPTIPGSGLPPFAGEPSWSADGSKIAFAQKFDGSLEIFVMNADGSGQTRLTNHIADDEEPSFSPDATKIAFRSTRDVTPQIWVMDANGANPQNLSNTNTNDEAPQWSPDGTKILFHRTDAGSSGIYVMNADGSGQVPVETGGTSASWSPDGSKIVIGGGPIIVMNSDFTDSHAITDTVGGYGPQWSPDGTRITFASARDGNAQIYAMDADGSNVVRLTNTTAMEDLPNWQPLANVAPTTTTTTTPPNPTPAMPTRPIVAAPTFTG